MKPEIVSRVKTFVCLVKTERGTESKREGERGDEGRVCNCYVAIGYVFVAC